VIALLLPSQLFAQTYGWSVGDQGHAATHLTDGSILLTGGQEGFDAVLEAAQRYVPSTGALLDQDGLSRARLRGRPRSGRPTARVGCNALFGGVHIRWN